MKSKGGVVSTWIIVLALILPAFDRAYGWGNTWMGANLEQIINAARWRVGPFKYYAALQLDNAGYDSDIYFGSGLNPVPDYTFTAGASFRLFLPVKKKIVFDISELPQYAFFLDTERERALNNAFTGQVHFIFDRFYVQAGGGLINAKDRLSTELNINVRHKVNSLSGLALWQVSNGTSFVLQYRGFKYDYEGLIFGGINIRENLNRQENYVDLAVYLQHHLRTRFYLGGEFGAIKFSEAVSRTRDTRSYNVYGGIEFLPPEGGYQGQTAGIRGRVDLGYTRFNILDPGEKDFSGLVGNTGVSIGIMKLTALIVFFYRGPQFSAYSDVASYVRTTYGVGLVRSLTRRILLTYNFYNSRNDYPSGDPAGGDPIERWVDRYTGHALRLDLRMRRDLQLSLFASLGKRDLRLASQSVSERTFIGFSLVYGYLSGSPSMLAGPISR